MCHLSVFCCLYLFVCPCCVCTCSNNQEIMIARTCTNLNCLDHNENDNENENQNENENNRIQTVYNANNILIQKMIVILLLKTLLCLINAILDFFEGKG